MACLGSRCYVLLIFIVALLLSGCVEAVETVKVSPMGWNIKPLGVPIAELYEVLSVGPLAMPTYNDCADAGGNPQSSNKCSLSLLFLASSDYKNADDTQEYTQHIQAIILDVFAVDNPMNQAGYFGQRLRPFRFYVSEYQYSERTPAKGACNPGLPNEWIQESNGRDLNVPRWNCNLALSTASTEIDIAFVMHKEDLADRSRFNLFSSEYNSYAAILHELSHATFAMSDEAPSTVQGGVFFPVKHPNVFRDEQTCQNTCTSLQSTCTAIPKVEANGVINPATQSGFWHCSTGEVDDANNIMYFYPQPTPGVNETWNAYAYMYSSINRLRHIFHDWCGQGRC